MEATLAQHLGQPFGTHVRLNPDVAGRQEPQGDGERQLVVFTLHSDQFAVPIETVREIVRYSRPTATAAASGLIRGMISLRGTVVPVADLSDRLGRDPHPGEGAQIVVFDLREGALGLIVDRVVGVRRVRDGQISPTPVPGAEKGFGDEIAAIDDELVLLLDPQRVLGSLLRPPRSPSPRAKEPAAGKAPGAKKPAAGKAPGAKKPAAAKAPRAKKPAAGKAPGAKTPAVARTPRARKPAASAKAKPAAKRRSPTRRPPAA